MVRRLGYYWVNSVNDLRGASPKFTDYLPAVNTLGVSALVMAGCEAIPDETAERGTRMILGREGSVSELWAAAEPVSASKVMLRPVG